MRQISIFWKICFFIIVTLLLTNAIAVADLPPESEWDEEGVCARVRIRISQDVAITRTAFRATLEIDNSPENVPIENMNVAIEIENWNRESSDDLFVIQDPELTNIDDINGNGTLAPGSSAKAVWIIIPTRDAAPDKPEQYYVGGTLSYTESETQMNMPLFPATITVKPDPLLVLNYFLVRNVYSDDPFTKDIIEPAQPFPLGLILSNQGKGTAHQVKITSAQPEIVENEKGLLIDFKIISTQVNDQEVTPSLTVDLGEIGPNQTSVAQWMMTSSLQGKFIEYNASFEHTDDLGDSRTSLIESVNIRELNHPVRIDIPDDDSKPDFLVNDIEDDNFLPDTLYNSDGSTSLVNVVSDAVVNGEVSNANPEVTLTGSAPNGWVYIRVNDPGEEQFTLKKVRRSDGRDIRLEDNAWTTHRTIRLVGESPYRERLLHLFDYIESGNFEYSLQFEGQPTEPEPPVLQFISDRSMVAGIHFGFIVKASDPNGTIPALSADPIPEGATFTDNGNGEGRFDWPTTEADIGKYEMTFAASDGQLSESQAVTITIYSGTDNDNDEMPDGWETEYFNTLDRDGKGDFDNDGLKDREEYLGHTDPLKRERSEPTQSPKVYEDTPYTFEIDEFEGLSEDVVSIRIVKPITAGILTLDGEEIGLSNPDVSVADIHDGNLIFMPDSDSYGETYCNLQFRTYDSESGEYGDDVYTMPIAVAPVNDPPSSADGEALLEDDGTYIFNVSDFEFEDARDRDVPEQGESNQFANISINQLEQKGDLESDGQDVYVGQVISVEDIQAGKLSYKTDDAPTSEKPYDIFMFRVGDELADEDAVSRSNGDNSAEGNGWSSTYVMAMNWANMPPDIWPQMFTIEDGPAGTLVGIAEGTDDEGVVEFEIVGGTGVGLFDVNPETGDVTVAPGAELSPDIQDTYTLDIRVTDQEGLTDEATMTINLIPTRPTIDLDADDDGGDGPGGKPGRPPYDFEATFREGDEPVNLADIDAFIDNPDGDLINSLTVTITNLKNGDRLAADTAGTNITQTYDPATGFLTLSGTDTEANYSSVLRTITFENMSANPDDEYRVVEFVAVDGENEITSTATCLVTVIPVNDDIDIPPDTDSGYVTISKIRMEPESPAHLMLLDRVYITFDYEITHPNGAYIWITANANARGESAPSALLTGTGTAERFIFLNSAGTVEELVITARAPKNDGTDEKELIYEKRLPVNYQYVEDTTLQGYTVSDGTNISYEVAGDGFPLVLIHGGEESETGFKGKASWDPQFDEFAKSFKVIRFDIRGFGESSLVGEHPLGSWSWGEKEHRATTDLVELMDYLGIQKAHICGLSIGSGIAAQLAVFHPGKVEKLILVSPWLGQTFPEDQGQMERLKMLSSKTLLTGGADDMQYLIESGAAEDAGYHPTQWTIDDAGHFCNSDQPEQFNTNLLVFLSPKLFVVKGDTVDINLSLLNPASGNKEDIQVEFPDGREATLVKSETYSRGPDNYTWSGKVENYELSSVVFSAIDKSMFGRINTGKDAYFIKPEGEGYKVLKHDPELMAPLINDTVMPEVRESRKRSDAVSARNDISEDGSFIDVLVLYTKQMEVKYGDNLEVLIQNFVDIANKAYTDSGINTQLRRAHIELYDNSASQEDSDIETALFHIKNSGDVAAIRDIHKADMVSLLRVHSGNEGEHCGYASVMSPDWSKTDYDAFSVVQVLSKDEAKEEAEKQGLTEYRYCSELSFAHELGHNLGCAHDRDEGGQGTPIPGAYEYSYGYDMKGRFGTIMSYEPLSDSETSEIDYFSTPLITNDDGYPLGKDEGEPDSADNARTINETRAIVAKFKINENTYPPEAKATPSEQTVDAGASVLLSAENSTDNGGILVYQWSQTEGPTVTFSDKKAVAPVFNAPTSGEATLKFQLTVTDRSGQEDTDTCTVYVSEPTTTTTAPTTTSTTTAPTTTTAVTTTSAPSTSTTVPPATTTVPSTTTTTSVSVTTTVPTTSTTTSSSVPTTVPTTTTSIVSTKTDEDSEQGGAGDTNCFIHTLTHTETGSGKGSILDRIIGFLLSQE